MRAIRRRRIDNGRYYSLVAFGLSVPIQFTESFAEALVHGGHNVETSHPDGVDHHAVYSAEVAGPLIAAWLDL